jgi:hypothetical protein
MKASEATEADTYLMEELSPISKLDIKSTKSTQKT